jgi:hypothetical protein
MSAQLPCPSPLAGARNTGRGAIRGKLALAHQRQTQRARLLAGVDASRAPSVPSHVHHGSAPSTPSSVDRVNRANQRSAEKLLLQAVVTAAEKTLSPIKELESPPALPPFVQRVVGGDNVTGGGEVNQTTVVCPSSMFDPEVQGKIDDPFFVVRPIACVDLSVIKLLKCLLASIATFQLTFFALSIFSFRTQLKSSM